MQPRDSAAGLSITCFGVGVRVRVDDPALLPKLRECLPPGSRESPPARAKCTYSYSILADNRVAGADVFRYHVGYTGLVPFVQTQEEAVALSRFESAVRFDVAAAADPWLFVHAGVVGWHGRAIVLPAPSRHGKSRLVEALVRAGAVYFSDEFAVLDDRGRVHPFAKPLSLREVSGGTRRVTAADIGGTVGLMPLRIGLVVSTRYECGGTWRPRRVTRGDGVLAMLANSVRARLAPRPILQTLAQALEDAVVFEGPRGEADQATPELLKLLHSAETDWP